MYGQDTLKGNKTQARWRRRSGINHASRCLKQCCLPLFIKQSNKTSVRPHNAIQHLQQRCFIGLMALHERKAGVDFCRSVSESKGGVNREVASGANRTGIVAKQSKLVWLNLVGSRQSKGIGNYFEQLASWCLCKVAENRLIKKLSSPCGGLIDPSISPYCGQIAMGISPYCGLIKACFATLLSPPHGHLLDIPLYTAVGERL